LIDPRLVRGRRPPSLATDRRIKLQICRYYKLGSEAKKKGAPATRRPRRKVVPTARRPQARGLARREAIIDAAVRLFARRGFRGTGILGLAEEVGISHVGVLHHFGTKEGLLLAVVESRDRRHTEQIEHLRQVRGLEALRALQQLGDGRLFDDLHARLFVVLVGENLHPEDPLNAYFRARAQDVRGFVANAVRTGQADKEIRDDADPEAIATEVLGFIAGITVQSVLNPEAVDVPGAYRRFVSLLIDHLRVEPT
jgi:AcrR family transcriptional regulator